MMNIIYSLLLAFLVLTPAWGANPVSVEDFKKITDDYTRAKIISGAPPEQEKELIKIHVHLLALREFGGEAGLKARKESYAAAARGLSAIEDVFGNQTQLWDQYMGRVLVAVNKSGRTPEQLELWRKLQKERDVIDARLSVVHSLVFNMAASPKALELDETVNKFGYTIMCKYSQDASTPENRITREQLREVDKQFDAFFEEMKKLPTLPPEQAQKECDDFPENRLGAPHPDKRAPFQHP